MTDAARGPQAVAELRGIHKRYGQVDALQGVDLELRPGELVALLGPNGAGKTTAVSILLGQRRPDAGTARLFGRDPTLPATRRPVGATLQESGFPDNLTVAEVVDLVRIHYPDPAPTRELLDRFGLAELAGRRAGGLSGGQTRRLAVALAFAGRPRLAVLDEPTTGLDVEARRGLWELLRAFVAEGGSVLLTTHSSAVPSSRARGASSGLYARPLTPKKVGRFSLEFPGMIWKVLYWQPVISASSTCL